MLRRGSQRHFGDFAHRRHAGEVLAGVIRDHDLQGDAETRPVIMGLGYSGIETGADTARRLRAPFWPVAFEEASKKEASRLEKTVRRGGEPNPLLLTEPPETLSGRTVIVVTDGSLPLTALRVGVRLARSRDAARVVLASGILSERAARSLAKECDQLLAVRTVEAIKKLSWFYIELPEARRETALAEMSDICTVEDQARPASDGFNRSPELL